MTFGSKLKSLRVDSNLTQLQLSVKLDTSKSNISKYEANIIEPNLKTLTMIAKLFHVSVDYLLGLTESNIVTPQKLAMSISNHEEKELLSYYEQLSQLDKRWIMGQMIDLIKKAETVSESLPKVAQ